MLTLLKLLQSLIKALHSEGTPAQVAAISKVCRRHGLSLHMDGARFANALATLGCSPAEATWKSGVDVLCFGATKNGALAAEAAPVRRLDPPALRAGYWMCAGVLVLGIAAAINGVRPDLAAKAEQAWFLVQLGARFEF